jgi:hypothetical protein
MARILMVLICMVMPSMLYQFKANHLIIQFHANEVSVPLDSSEPNLPNTSQAASLVLPRLG